MTAMEDELARVRLELDIARREIDAIGHAVGHDMRASLRAIDGFASLLHEDCADRLDDAGREHLGTVRASAKRLARQIEQLTALTKISRAPLWLTDVDLSALAAGALARLTATQPARRVALSITPGVVARGDAKLLERALGELCDNAWKFTSDRDTAHIAFGCRSEGDERTYFVRDDGMGFDMAHTKKLFGIFRRLHTSPRFAGEGAGLAQVHRIVERHGGRIWAEATTGGGAAFFFTLGAGEAS